MSTRNIGLSTLVLTVIAVAAVLYVLSGILIPIVLAGFLTVLYKPLVSTLRNKGAPTWVGLIIALIITAGAIWGVSLILSFGFESMVEKTPEYTEKIRSLLTDFQRYAGKTTRDLLGTSTVVKIDKVLTSENIIGFLTKSLGSAVSIIADGVLVLLFMVFMTLGGEHFPAKVRASLRLMNAPELETVYHAINDKVLKYLRVKTVFNVINGGVMFTVLTVFGVDFAPLIGLLAFLFNYLPNIGSFLATLIPGIIALIQFGSLPQALLIVGILVVLQNIVGNFLEPRAMGSSFDLSPTIVLFSLVFWGWMWGVVGMILSVPVMAMIKTIMEHFPVTQPIAVLLSNRAPVIETNGAAVEP